MNIEEVLKDQKILNYIDPEYIKNGIKEINKEDIIYKDTLTRYNNHYNSYEYYFFLRNKNGTYVRSEIDLNKAKEITYLECTCYEFNMHENCKHLGAIAYYYYDTLFKKDLTKIYNNILDLFLNNTNNIIKKEVKVELVLKVNENEYSDFYYYSRQFVDVKLLLGTNKMYNLGNKYSSFFTVYSQGEGEVKFGKEFTYNPQNNYFTQESLVILNAYYEYMHSPYNKIRALKKLLKDLKETNFIINDYAIDKINEGFPIKSSLTKDNTDYKLNLELDNLSLIIEDDYEYILYQGKMYHLNIKEQELLQNIIDNELDYIIIKEDNKDKFKKGLLEYLKKNIEIDDKIDDIILPSNIVKEIYFDLRNNYIKADCIFKYDDIKVNYFMDNSNILRDMEEENKVINDLLSYGFMVNDNCLELKDLEDQVKFLENGLEDLASKYVIYTTEKFKSTTIKKKTNVYSMFRIGQDNIFNFSFAMDGINSQELVNIFKEIKNKKKYYRLKNGDIISLEDESLKNLESLADDLELSDEEIKEGKGTILKYRAIYLDSLKNTKYNNVIKTDNLFVNFINNFYAYKDAELTLAKKDLSILRDYQLTGVKWLYNLAKTGFGGILADEMGLGKTIQVIYYLKQILKEQKEALFLIVVPTSLAYNWDHEFSLYGNNIKRVVCLGTKNKRKELLNNLKDVNVLITTYGLLREDLEEYQNLSFHTMIIDEAQNIKNSNAGVTKGVKKIKAETKFALTGTPLENSLLELWSIFDFIMPGYLASLTKFQSKYHLTDFDEDSLNLIKGLNKQINPFILRRKKEDVIKELPEKLINDIYLDLTDKQKTLYVAEMEKVKKQMEDIMATDGISKARFMILKLLMRLRQICIDPAIIYENYDGSSNKIETLIAIVNEYIKNNHKILIFSSFKTALNIVKENLAKEDILSYMIDGSVPSKERINMVDNFNEKDDIKVFLIMLKSGGTGLNLTAADVVIHLDLWWNPQAENQATDRAHRIGQTKTVEVIHLVTKGTIEEKILELQNKKRILSDKVIDGEVRDKNIISSLTKEDIENLLSYENKD